MNEWICFVTCPGLEPPLLLVNLSFPNEISWRIQCAPVFGESECICVLFAGEIKTKTLNLKIEQNTWIVFCVLSYELLTRIRCTNISMELWYCILRMAFYAGKLKCKITTAVFVLYLLHLCPLYHMGPISLPETASDLGPRGWHPRTHYISALDQGQ